MSDIKTYKLENYVPGKTSFEVSLGDIFVVPNNETLKSIDYVSISNNGIIQCKKECSGTNTKFIFTPTSNIKEPNHKYDVTVKFTLTTEISSDDNTTSVKTRNCFIKLILTPEINDTTSRLYIVNYMGKLNPDEYMKEHIDKDDLSSLVTKKALITNLKEFGKQVQNKVSNVQVFAIRYDLDGGSWNSGNEGRTSFVNSIAYVAPQPVKLGYTFNGWKIYKIADDLHSQQLNETISVDSMIPVGTNYDTLCVADWIRNNYKVTCYNASNEPIFSLSIEYNKNSTLLKASVDDTKIILPTKAGYTLDYWATTDKFGQIITCKSDQNLNNVYDQIFEASNENIDRHIYLKPHFEPNVYTLNYNLNGGNLDGSDDTINTYKYGTTFTLPIPRRNGYKFDGWTIGSLVNQFVINPTDLENVTTSTVEVKASWVAATFHLDFDLQNGSIANNSNYTLKANTPIVLSNPTRPGYTFDGWKYDSADGSITLDNTTKKYTFTPSDTVDHDITLTAIWKASEETEYTLQIWEETFDSTGTFTADNDTCVYRLIKSISKTGKTGTDTGFTSSNLTASSGYSIPTGFELSKIENVSIKADGTSICKIYIHRKACTITIIDKYDITDSSSFTNRTYTSLYRTDINNIGTTTSNKISGKFGQTLIAYPIFNDTYPELNYTCNTSGKSLVFNITNQTVIFTYTKKNVRVTFDLNNVGTWTINGNEFNSDIYSIDIPYGAILNNSHIPNVTNHNAVSSSKWVVESTEADKEIGDFTKYKFTKDTKIRRIPTFYNNKIIISTENYDETNFSITNVINSTYYTTSSSTNYLSTSIRPIELLTPAFDAYNFIGYKYKFGANSSFSDKYITSINKDIWTTTSANSDLYIKACLERKEPTLDLSGCSVTYTSRTLTVENVTLNNGATKFYISSTVPNADVSTNLGNGSILATGDKHTASISGSFATDKNHNTVVLIPSKETSTVKITGKPFIGTITEIDGKNGAVTVSWIQSYQVYDNQDDASISSISISGSNNHTDVSESTTIKVTTNAEKVLVNKNGSLNIADVENNETTFTIENNFVEATTKDVSFSEAIQLTPIRYNKTGKSSIVRALKTSTNVNEIASSDIIAFDKSGTYYQSPNYTIITDSEKLLGLQIPTAFTDSVVLENDSAISIDNVTTTVPSKNNIEATQIDLEYYYSDNSVFTYNDSKVYSTNVSGEANIDSARSRGIALYAQDGSVIAGLYKFENNEPYNSNIPFIENNNSLSRLISLSSFSIGTLNTAPSLTQNLNVSGTIYYEIVKKTYNPPVTDGDVTLDEGYYSYDSGFDKRFASSEVISITSLNNITSGDILSKTSHKIKIKLPSGFYIYNGSKFDSVGEVYIEYTDLAVKEVKTNTTSNGGAETNLCIASQLSTSNTYNTSNSAKFIKKAGGITTAKVKIPVTKYNSIIYSHKDNINEDIKSKTSIVNTPTTLNMYKIHDNPNIVITTSDSTLIPYNNINLSNKILQVNYIANKSIQRKYSAYTTEIEAYL